MAKGKRPRRDGQEVDSSLEGAGNAPSGLYAVGAVALLAVLALINPLALLDARGQRQALEKRAQAANELLAAMLIEGASIHPAVEIRATLEAGLGLYVNATVPPNTVLFSLPTNMMILPEETKDSTTKKKKTSKATESSAVLPVALARAQFSEEQSEYLKLYVSTLPKECPPNLAQMKPREIELVSHTLHGWKVNVYKEGHRNVRKAFPDLPEKDVRWMVCMILSRSLAGPTGSAALMPFIDLINHGTSCFMSALPEGGRSVVSKRQLNPGDEITFSYAESPSRARLLTSFGFVGDAPAASLVAKDLPTRDPVFLDQNGCAGFNRIDLELESKRLAKGTMLKALRCVRLHIYSPEEAAIAVETGRLDLPWEEIPAEPQSMLKKDLRVIINTLNICSDGVSEKSLNNQAVLVRELKGKSEIGRAVSDETTALVGCHEHLIRAHKALTPKVDNEATTPQV